MCEGDDKDTHIYTYKEHYQYYYMISMRTYIQGRNIKINAVSVWTIAPLNNFKTQITDILSRKSNLILHDSKSK